jgi:NTP pyrophosphatase (non-canonical NTP hydrolase)
MTGNEYQALARRTINKELTMYEQYMHALHGLVGEIGELHSIFQKRYQGHKPDTEHMKKELGDILWFVAEFCTAWGWKLEDVMQLNIDKLRARYPEGFDADKSLHRKDGDV